MRMIQKFGGTSLASAEKLRRAADHVAGALAEGWLVAAVVSAQGNTTDALIEKALALTPKPDPRELDLLLCIGEQASAALLAMLLRHRGIPAAGLTGIQAGIATDGRFGNGEIVGIDPRRVSAMMAAGTVPVVAGFQGGDRDGNLTTLSRGGSDTTAVALAGAVGARLCRIYTDVDGVYDCDPRHNPGARRYDRIGYDDMLALARSGAQVLHPRCVSLAKKYAVAIEVCSAETGLAGTTVDAQ